MAQPTTCVVHGILLWPTGEPVISNEIEVFLAVSNALPQFAQGSLVTGKSVLIETDENGYFEVALIKGALVTMHIKLSNFQCQFAVPLDDSADIADLPGNAGVLRQVENPF
jgi:hypothetical protein